MAEYTPMIKQYLEIKAQYEDAFLFFRLGDFYELFFDDAKLASQELEITLTGRGADKDRIPMCGVPYHAADNYIAQLIDKGYKIALCEQVEDPKTAKGVVRREVVKLITPGTMMESKKIQEKENLFLASVTPFEDGSFGIARSDLTTGENFVTMVHGFDELVSELAVSRAKEVVLPSNIAEDLIEKLRRVLHLTISYEDGYELPEEFGSLCKHIGQTKLEQTFARLCNYLIRTQKRALDHMQPVEFYTTGQVMKIDFHSKRNLELTETIREKKKKGSLLWLLDDTVTAMGGRMLRNWLDRPLIDETKINQRLSIVEVLYHHYFEREEIRDVLKGVYDIERLAAKVAYGNVNARDLVQLRHSLGQVPEIVVLATKLNDEQINQLVSDLHVPEVLVDLLETSLIEEPPFSVKEGGMIRDGYHEQLDIYRDAIRNGKAWIADLEQRERAETGIKSLKVGFNKIFGYYIEVTRSNLASLPEGRYERKQTLANAERFVTPELKEKEILILEAKEKIEELEYEIFQHIREQVKGFISFLQKLAKKISVLDVLQSFASISEKNHYTRPLFSIDREVHIVDGRHSVVERVLPQGAYVANDILMKQGREMLLITGPNMAGKSTYMRQLALISVMAQVGCFVPATEATLPVFDQIFTRIGAADDLASGQSTFMVEMLETKEALVKATNNSLILLDEIGRGTSTYDGMALAQAIMEFIHDNIGAKTMFSTHYHELTTLETDLSHVKNVHVSAVEENGKVVFLHKVIDGQADRSYGIYVAELAEMPKAVIERAGKILSKLENKEQKASEPEQLSLFIAEDPPVKEKKRKKAEQDVLDAISNTDVLHLTPFEALHTLNELQKTLKSK